MRRGLNIVHPDAQKFIVWSALSGSVLVISIAVCVGQSASGIELVRTVIAVLRDQSTVFAARYASSEAACAGCGDLYSYAIIYLASYSIISLPILLYLSHRDKEFFDLRDNSDSAQGSFLIKMYFFFLVVGYVLFFVQPNLKGDPYPGSRRMLVGYFHLFLCSLTTPFFTILLVVPTTQLRKWIARRNEVLRNGHR